MILTCMWYTHLYIHGAHICFWPSRISTRSRLVSVVTSVVGCVHFYNYVCHGALHAYRYSIWYTHYRLSVMQLAPSIKYLKLWCYCKALILPVLLVGRMSASWVIHNFTSLPTAFGFWASLCQITLSWLLLVRRLVSPSTFHTTITANVHATLET